MEKDPLIQFGEAMPLPLPPSSLIDTDDRNGTPPGAALVIALFGSLLVWSVLIVYLFWR